MLVRRIAAIALLLAASGHANVAGQGLEPVYERPQWMIGYVANAPHMLLGGGVVAMPTAMGGWGIYLDAKTGLDNIENDEFFESDITPGEAENQFGDVFADSESYWRGFNVALVRALRDDLILYAGGGRAEERAFLEFFDPTQERGNLGYYWVEDEQSGGRHLNVMAGMYFRLFQHIAAQFGFESAPFGLTVGVLGVL